MLSITARVANQASSREHRSPRMNALIHLHPHFGHFTQSIILAKKIAHINNVTCLLAPSLQRKSSIEFFSYLQHHENSLAVSLETRFAFKRLRTFKSFSYKAIASLSRCPTAQLGSLHYAVKDSLIRGRYSYLYSLLPSPLRQAVELLFKIKAGLLFSAYQLEMLQSRPKICIISHSTYVPYVAFIEAATRLDIPVLVLYGAVERAILITRPSLIYHITNSAQLIMSERPIDSNILANVTSSYADASSLYCLNRNQSPSSTSSLSEHSGPTVLLLLTHCIKDNNYVSDPSQMLFTTYFIWLLRTAFHLLRTPCNYDLIVFKIHPHARAFRDYAMLWILGKICSIGVNRSRTLLTNSKSFESDLARIDGIPRIYPVTFHGSVAYENASIGMRTITVGSAPAPVGSCFHPKSKGEYFSALTSPLSLPDSFDKPTIKADIQSARYLILVYEAMKPPLKEEILSLRQYFYFADSTPLQPEPLHATYQSLMNSQSVSLHPLENGTKLICYGL